MWMHVHMILFSFLHDFLCCMCVRVELCDCNKHLIFAQQDQFCNLFKIALLTHLFGGQMNTSKKLKLCHGCQWLAWNFCAIFSTFFWRTPTAIIRQHSAAVKTFPKDLIMNCWHIGWKRWCCLNRATKEKCEMFNQLRAMSRCVCKTRSPRKKKLKFLPRLRCNCAALWKECSWQRMNIVLLGVLC